MWYSSNFKEKYRSLMITLCFLSVRFFLLFFFCLGNLSFDKRAFDCFVCISNCVFIAIWINICLIAWKKSNKFFAFYSKSNINIESKQQIAIGVSKREYYIKKLSAWLIICNYIIFFCHLCQWVLVSIIMMK